MNTPPDLLGAPDGGGTADATMSSGGGAGGGSSFWMFHHAGQRGAPLALPRVHFA